MKVRFRDLQDKYGDVCLMFDVVPLHYMDKWGDNIELKINDVFDVSYDYPDFTEALKSRGINLEEITFTFRELYKDGSSFLRNRLEELLYDVVYDGEIDFELELNKDFIQFLYKKDGNGKVSFVYQAINNVPEEILFEVAKYLKLKEIDNFNSMSDFFDAENVDDRLYDLRRAIFRKISGFNNDRMFEAILQIVEMSMGLR